MIPMSGSTAGGKNIEINTSAFGNAETERDGRPGKAQSVICFTLTNAVCFLAANFTALP